MQSNILRIRGKMLNLRHFKALVAGSIPAALTTLEPAATGLRERALVFYAALFIRQ
jgi:hypothetical protein